MSAIDYAIANSSGLTGLGQVVVVISAIVSAWPAVRRQWRDDRAGALKTLKLLAIYLVYCLAGVLLLVMFAPREPGTDPIKAVPMMTLILAWIFYGALWLARLVPRDQDLPAWVDRRDGPIDRTFIAIIIGSVVWLLI